MFVEKQVDGVQPSPGYAYLCNLISETYFNTVFTTNFDDLINESFYQFTDLRPILCAHDSSISSITVTSKRPKIIKLHGDYLFDDIKSTLRETESLEENIKNKFIEFTKDFGIIFIGYSGIDRSVMDVMNYLLKQEDYLKNGIYWCLREGDSVSEELRKLLWKDRVYYVVIDGFDEFFAFNYKQIKGETFPIETGFVSSKSQDIVKRMLENSTLKDSRSEIIANHLDQLREFSKKHSLQNTLSATSNSDYLGEDENEFTDDELVKLLKIKEKNNRELYTEVINDCNKCIADSSNNSFKIEALKLLIIAHKRKKEKNQVLKTYEKIIELDSKNPIHLLNKSKYEDKIEKKLALIEMELQKDHFFYGSYYEKAELLKKKYFTQFCDSLFDEIISLYDDGIGKYPALGNLCYNGKFNFLQTSRIESGCKSQQVEKLIEALENQRADSSIVLRMRLKKLKHDNKKPEDDFLQKIIDAKNKYPERNEIDYDILMIEALSEIGNKLEIEKFLLTLENSKKHEISIEFLKSKASAYAEKLRDLKGAVCALEKALNIEEDSQAIKQLLKYYVYIKEYDKFKNGLKKYSNSLEEIEVLNLEKDYYEHIGDFKNAYHKFCEYRAESLFPDNLKDQLSYHLIQIGEYAEAKRTAKEHLDEIGFNKRSTVGIINYELAQVLLDNSRLPNKKRLCEAYDVTSCEASKGAIQCLLKDSNKAFYHINKALEDDFTDIFSFLIWPVYKTLHSDPRWQEITKALEL